MKLDFQAEALKAAPAVGGAATSIAAKAAGLDWSVLAAQATFFYVVIQALYLLWKWYSEAQERKNPWKSKRR